MNSARIINAAVDCVGHFLRRGYPLKNIAREIIAERKLNSSDRHVFLDVVFAWAREAHAVDAYVRETFPFSNAMSAQQKSALAVKIAGVPFVDGDPDMVSLRKDFQTWLHARSDQSLLALGPFVGGEIKKDFGTDAEACARGMFASPKKYLAVVNISPDEVVSALAEQNIAVFRSPLFPRAIGILGDISRDDLPKSIAPHVWFMDIGSQLIASLVTPQEHESVLDLCTGEGNKARFITAQPCNYVAVDVDARRLESAKARLRKDVEFVVGDGRKLTFPSSSFDWILLDAPCSGIGVLRRHPDLLHRLEEKDLVRYIQLQQDLLASAVKWLKPGGKLIYSTCSVFDRENGQQIISVIKKNHQIKPISLRDLLSEETRLDNIGSDNSITLLPHIHDCDGFFAAALTKVS